ncbi:uncharacterized protein LOC143286177 isoform X2 [Babylonia areolata]|uniref:uncharacterized protein LOC143286177 isoform X2 n=1 Tax=Babylonia areolata TaxID=304850 RepID=UPI003FD2C977
MGKLQSKHVRRTSRVPGEAECFLVNAHLNKALEEQIWKKKSGLDLANYNMDQSLSELSICLEDKCGSVPLRVELPPQLGETDTSKVLKLDQEDGEDDDDDDDEGEEKEEKVNNLNIEEIECGVQFEGTENSKQEWSFTLYDFDGHGRITKEDLASLLKALYDAVGSSIRLPPNGAKTLKLRLTVGQDRTQIHAISAGKPLGARGKRKENGGSSGKAKTCKESSPKAPKPFSKLNNLTRATVKVNNQTQEAAGQGQGQAEASGSGLGRKHLSLEDQQQLVELVQENMERNHVKQLRRHHSDCHGPGGEKPGHHHKRRHKGRSGGGQSKSAGGGATVMAGAAVGGVGGMLSPTVTTTTTTTTATALALAEDRSRGVCGESQDRRNYYLDLAGVDSSKLNNATTTTPAPAKMQNVDQGGAGYHRSRSHDVKCDNVKRESDRMLLLESSSSPRGGAGGGGGGFPHPHHHHHHLLQHNHLRSRSFDPQDNAPRAGKTTVVLGASAPEGAEAPTKIPGPDCTTTGAVGGGSGGGGGVEGSPHKHSRFRPVSLPGHVPTSVSPHYHRRHRHREKDHDLAMQQVAAWIERQHAWDLEGGAGERGGGVIVQRHHHHHIHEHHHHHHYHHYYEA